MAVMQRAHCWDQPNPHAFAHKPLAPNRHAGERANDLHEPGGELQAGRDPYRVEG